MAVKVCNEDGLTCPHPHKSCEECIEEENRWAEAWIEWYKREKS